jgi:hypothetical protein
VELVWKECKLAKDVREAQAGTPPGRARVCQFSAGLSPLALAASPAFKFKFNLKFLLLRSLRPRHPPRAGPATTTPAAPPPAAAAPPADPEDWSSELARLDLELRRLGWSREQEGEYLQRSFSHPSRSRITSYTDLKSYLDVLEGLPPGAEPARSPVPLRRRDLLVQSDQLLVALGWQGEQARQFLEQQLGASSRQQLNDSKLLHFNMLLEGELLERDPTGGRMDNPPAPPP